MDLIKKRKWPLIIICSTIFTLILGLLIGNVIYARVTAKRVNYYIKTIELEKDYKHFKLSLKGKSGEYFVSTTTNNLHYYIDNDEGIKGYAVIETTKEWFEPNPKERITDVYLNAWYSRMHVVIYY